MQIYPPKDWGLGTEDPLAELAWQDRGYISELVEDEEEEYLAGAIAEDVLCDMDDELGCLPFHQESDGWCTDPDARGWSEEYEGNW